MNNDKKIAFTIAVHPTIHADFKQLCDDEDVSVSEGFDAYFEVCPDKVLAELRHGANTTGSVPICLQASAALRDDVRELAKNFGVTQGAVVEYVMIWALQDTADMRAS